MKGVKSNSHLLMGSLRFNIAETVTYLICFQKQRMNIVKYFIITALLKICILPFSFICAQSNGNDWKAFFAQSYYAGFKNLPPLRQQWRNLSVSKPVENMQPLSYALDAILAMFETTDSTVYLDDAIDITNNIIDAAQVTETIPGNTFKLKDNYKGWIVNDSSFDKNSHRNERVLSEAYFFQYVTRLLKDIHNNAAVYNDVRYKKFYNQTLDFVETEVWNKWENRGLRYSKNRYNYLLLGRTHMASHWAYIAAELSILTGGIDRKADYIKFVNLYNYQLEKNFYRYDKYISWDQTWDTRPGYNKNLKNNDNVQDVSHANLVISYIVEAYDLGLWKDFDVIQRIINTLKDKLWYPENCVFRDNMDGTMFKLGGGGSVGSFQADGFIKLTRYDRSLFTIYQKFIDCSPLLTRWFQYGQLFANLALSEKLLTSHH